MGNWYTVNGRFRPQYRLQPDAYTRLRLLNVANARRMGFLFKGPEPLLVSLDGQPVSPQVVGGSKPLWLAPGQRADVLDGPERPHRRPAVGAQDAVGTPAEQRARDERAVGRTRRAPHDVYSFRFSLKRRRAGGGVRRRRRGGSPRPRPGDHRQGSRSTPQALRIEAPEERRSGGPSRESGHHDAQAPRRRRGRFRPS